MYTSTMLLDKWFETEVIPQLTGFAQLVRYADDNVFCFENEAEARASGSCVEAANE
jgi:RNA-directed DNA polymerase